jgi:DNA-binding LacI/PurR family transcriptional regulator
MRSPTAWWRSLRRLGLRVPDDVSLVGFDDREEALLMDPQLTTVCVHKEQVGEQLMNLLLEKLRRPKRASTSKWCRQSSSYAAP